MSNFNFRVGQGYDIHRLVEGIPLFLGGIEIEFDKGLRGHSDGDVLAHAVIDALLGAANLGDIGQHFPPSDKSIEGIKSMKMLAAVAEILKENDYKIGNLDCTIVCEQPKLSKLYSKMSSRLAEVLNLQPEQISIKAKTKEKLGPVGQGEAMEAHAVAIIFKDQKGSKE